MVTTGSLPVLAFPRAPLRLLLLLLTITTTTRLVKPAGALDTSATGTPTDDAIETCSVQVTDCEADPTCHSCMRMDSSSASEALECFEEAGIDDVESFSAECYHLSAGVCCFDLVSEFDCLENDQFVAYWRCFLDAKGCPEEELTCDSDIDASNGTDDGGTDDGNRDGTDDGTGGGTYDGTESGTDDDIVDGTTDGTTDGVDGGTDDGNDEATDDGNGVGNDDGDVGSAEGASTGGGSTTCVGHASSLVVAVCYALVISLPVGRA